jgi:hypothetical protein
MIVHRIIMKQNPVDMRNSLDITRGLSVAVPSTAPGHIVEESDWNYALQMVSRIHAPFSRLDWIPPYSFGIATTLLLGLLPLFTLPAVPTWIWITYWALFIAASAISVLALLYSRMSSGIETSSKELALEALEKAWSRGDSADPASVDK